MSVGDMPYHIKYWFCDNLFFKTVKIKLVLVYHDDA